MDCKNCGYEYELKFCPNCGQKHIERLSVPYFIDLFIGSLFHLHVKKSLLETMNLLIVSPKKVAYEYIRGKRVKYYNPASLYIIFSGLYFFTRLHGSSESYEKIQANDYYTLILIIISLPIMASLSYVFFKNYNFNFGEHLIFALFYYSINYAFFTIYNLFFHIIGHERIIGEIWIAIIILVYFYLKVFDKRKIISFLKLLFITPIAIILPLLLMIPIVEYLLT